MNLQGLLNINKKILLALEEALPVVALPTDGFSNNSDYIFAASAFAKEDCAFAPICINEGVLCIGASEAQVKKAFANGEAPVQLSELPLALAAKKSAALSASATVLVAGLCGIKVVCTASKNNETQDLRPQDIAALRSNPVLLIGCAKSETLNKIIDLGLPAYCAKEYSCDIIASVCQTKWDLGISSGVMYSASYENLYQNAAQCAKNI